jgi:hypothetical protein
MHLVNKDAHSQRWTCQVSSDPHQIGSEIFPKRLVNKAYDNENLQKLIAQSKI